MVPCMWGIYVVYQKGERWALFHWIRVVERLVLSFFTRKSKGKKMTATFCSSHAIVFFAVILRMSPLIQLNQFFLEQRQ